MFIENTIQEEAKRQKNLSGQTGRFQHYNLQAEFPPWKTGLLFLLAEESMLFQYVIQPLNFLLL